MTVQGRRGAARWVPVVGGATAVAAGFGAASSTGLLVLLVAVLLAAVARWPAAALLAALLLCQEFMVGSGGGTGESAPFSAVVGHQLYYGLGGADSKQSVAPLLLLVAVGVVAAGAHLPARSSHSVELGGLGTSVAIVVVGLVVWTWLMGQAAGGSPIGALNQEARPFLLLSGGLVIGALLRARPAEEKITARVVPASLAALSLLAVAALVTGEAGLDLNTEYPVFYDAALPAVAGAVVIAVLFRWGRDRTGWSSTAGHLGLGLVAAAILVLSFRRSIWLATVVALVVGLLIARGRGDAARRLVLGSVCAIPVVFLVPALASFVVARVDSAVNAFGSTDVSTAGHVSDIELGWRYVQAHPVLGIGSRHPPLAGLVVQNSDVIYVHNEWLLDWLRFGVVGAVLVTVLFCLLIAGAVRVFRHETGIARLVAAAFVLVVPVACTNAAFLSTTERWPVLLGLAAGVLVVERRSRPNGPDQMLPEALDDPGRPHQDTPGGRSLTSGIAAMAASTKASIRSE